LPTSSSSGQRSRTLHWIQDPSTGGTLNLDSAGAGVLLICPKGEQLQYVLQLLFKATNNAAEYEALIHGLQIAASLGIKRLIAFGDSKVVIQQSTKIRNAPRKRWTPTAAR